MHTLIPNAVNKLRTILLLSYQFTPPSFLRMLILRKVDAILFLNAVWWFCQIKSIIKDLQ